MVHRIKFLVSFLPVGYTSPFELRLSKIPVSQQVSLQFPQLEVGGSECRFLFYFWFSWQTQCHSTPVVSFRSDEETETSFINFSAPATGALPQDSSISTDCNIRTQGESLKFHTRNTPPTRLTSQTVCDHMQSCSQLQPDRIREVYATVGRNLASPQVRRVMVNNQYQAISDMHEIIGKIKVAETYYYVYCLSHCKALCTDE